MNSDKYVQNLDLEYLLNPILQNQIDRNELLISNEFKNDLNFYKKRIIQKTKDFCKNFLNNDFNNINDGISLAYLNLFKQLIYDFKIEDEKDLLQKDYENQMEINKEISENNIKKITKNETDLSNNIINNYDNLITKDNSKKINLDSFVKLKKNTTSSFVPNRRIVDINNPELRYKGLKKKNINNI